MSDPPRLSYPEIIAALDGLYGPCVLCEHRCGAMRADGERGACGLDDRTPVYNRMLHMGEERALVPSYTIFLSGCSLLCSFCSEFEQLRPPFSGAHADPVELAGRVAAHIEALRAQVPIIRNVNLVGGEPSISLPWIARFGAALKDALKDAPPLLLNTNGYMTAEALALATHLCRIFVVDLKFGDDRCAEQIGDVPRYTATLHRNLSLLHAADGEVGGVAVLPSELWVRHLLMPGHLECCTRPALRWLAEHTPEARVNVMPAFVPFRGGANTPWRALTAEEREAGLRLLREVALPHASFDGRPLPLAR